MGRRHSGEEGAVAVVTAIILTVLIALVAFVVDLGFVRADTRRSQNASDNAAQAGVAALAEGKTFEEACMAAIAMLEINLDMSMPPGMCDEFAPGSFENGTTCEERGAADASLPPTNDASDAPPRPVYAEAQDVTTGEYTVRIQMPVRPTDDQMQGQALDADHDGDDPCKRIGVSVRRTRDLIFGSFAGADGGVSGVADSVSRYETGERFEDIPSLIVLDPTGCRTLQVGSNGGRLLVRNLVREETDDDGNPVTVSYPGLITVDSDGTGCGDGAQEYVSRTNAGARLCAGVEYEVFAAFLAHLAAGGSCDSEPGTLRGPAYDEDRPERGIYGRAAEEGQVDPPTGPPNIEPAPVRGPAITREPADHEWNCRPDYTPDGTPWRPLYETDIAPCEGRAANMDELLDDLAAGTTFLPGTSTEGGAPWQTIAGCNPTGEIGNGTTNLYFSCNGTLTISSRTVINAADYIVVRGWVDVSTAAGELYVNWDLDPATGAVTRNDRDAVMVVRGKKSGNPGVGLAVGSSADLRIHRTMVYLHQGATAIDADSAEWTAPEPSTPGYNDDGTPGSCIEQVGYTGPVYDLPSPECFDNLALWTNNVRVHTLRGGAELKVEGVFFSPYAGRSSGAFDLSGGISQELAKAQFFSYKFDMSGTSTLVLQPDPTRNLRVPSTALLLIR